MWLNAYGSFIIRPISFCIFKLQYPDMVGSRIRFYAINAYNQCSKKPGRVSKIQNLEKITFITLHRSNVIKTDSTNNNKNGLRTQENTITIVIKHNSDHANKKRSKRSEQKKTQPKDTKFWLIRASELQYLPFRKRTKKTTSRTMR